MTFPTPSGNASQDVQLTGGGQSWQNQPTNQTTFDMAVQYVAGHYGQKIAGYFQQWYAKVWAKDPKITPLQAIGTFLIGYDIAVATGKLASFLTGSTYQVSSGGVNLGGGSQGPGVAQAAAQAAEGLPHVPNPLDALRFVADFFKRLSDPHTWLRVAEGLVGVAFLIIGLNALLKNPVGKVTRVAAKVVP